jgi:hypothetical protein
MRIQILVARNVQLVNTKTKTNKPVVKNVRPKLKQVGLHALEEAVEVQVVAMLDILTVQEVQDNLARLVPLGNIWKKISIKILLAWTVYYVTREKSILQVVAPY